MPYWVMLRSAQKKTAKTTTLNTKQQLKDIDDMWTLLFYNMLKASGATGTIWKMGKAARIRYDDTLEEIWSPTIEKANLRKPNLIFNRGGYSDYSPFLDKYPKTFKIYYGAGMRYVPSSRAGYNIVYVDSLKQVAKVKDKIPKCRVELLHKPTIASIFKPVFVPKIYDAVWMASSGNDAKGYSWLTSKLPFDSKILRIGTPDNWFKGATHLNVDFTGKIERKEIPEWACKAKIGIVCDDGKYDSGPRILSEYLAMGIPILVRDTVRTDLNFFCNEQTGRICNDKNFVQVFKDMVSNFEAYSPRPFYEQHLKIEDVARQMVESM